MSIGKMPQEQGNGETAGVPIPDSYWVIPGRLLAGEYPGHQSEELARPRLRRFLDAGITSFFDLTMPGELHPYAPYLPPGTRYQRLPIRDLAVPAPQEMERILDTLEAELAQGQVVYLHCWAGVGRTGVVVGCWLARQGLAGAAALAQLQVLRAGTPKASRLSPETEEQCRLVQEWPAGAGNAGSPVQGSWP